MKLSYKWLKDYVDIDADADVLANGLTMSGSEVGSKEMANGDTVMELEITSNRPDCLSIMGLAREVSAVFAKKMRIPSAYLEKRSVTGSGEKAECKIASPDLCPRYTARVIMGVKIRESSGKIAERLESLGMRKVNNVVDITNFCLMESGQPLHAFDLDRIKGGTINVRPAVRGEKIITIDGVERELSPETLVIADQEKPIAIAGVMGGRDTEVTSDTKNILLESAYFDPVSIRRTSRSLGLSSDSSYRFERGVDKAGVRPASDRATELILETAGGKTAGFYDSGPYGEKRKVIELDASRTGRILGKKLDQKEIAVLLERLSMGVSLEKNEKIKVTVPTFREDISREIDLVEEVARISGYHNIPETLPLAAPWSSRKSTERETREKIKKLLCAMGLNEIMTYSLISEKSALNFPELCDGSVRIRNPLSSEQEFLTPHLIDGMLKAAAWNINRGNKDLLFFEFGKKYARFEENGCFAEIPLLSLGITGRVARNWIEGEKKADVYRLKGILENIAEHLRFRFDFKPANIDGFKDGAGISVNGVETGFLGEAGQREKDIYGISQDIFICQISLSEIYKNACLRGSYLPLPRFPFSYRDISVLCDKSVRAEDIKRAAEKNGGGITAKIEIVDMYQGKQIPPDKKSVTFSLTYGLPDRTLTEQEIEKVHEGIKEALRTELNVSFR